MDYNCREMEKPGFRKQIFLIFFIALFLLVARLFYPFMTILVWSGLLYAFLEPLYLRITGVLDKGARRPIGHSFLAGTLALLGVALIIVPFISLGIALVRQVLDTARSSLHFVENNPHIFDLSPDGVIGGFIFRLSGGSLDLSGLQLVDEVKHFLASSTNSIINMSGRAAKNLASMVITVAFMVFTLFFLLVDGRHLMSVLVDAVPIERVYTTMFLQKMRETSKQLVKGFFLVSLYQGTAMFVISLIFGFKNALVMAVLTAVASFVPMVGTGLVWGPLTLILAMTGPLWKAVVYGLVSAVFVSSVDNILRPLVLGERLRIHPLLIFFAILGGVQLFGVNGLILGPLILIVFFAAVELYEKIELEPGNKADPPSGD